MQQFSLGPLEKQIMDIVWNQGEVSVKQVHQHLSSKKQIAYTTVMTLMGRLTDKGWLSKRKHGRKFLYLATKQKQLALKEMVAQTVQQFIDRFGEEAAVAFWEEADKRAHDSKSK